MELTHSFKDYIFKGTQQGNPSFLLTNKRGGFYFGAPNSLFSMYNGLFFPYTTADGWNLYKTIAFVGILKNAQVVDNHFSHCILKKDGAQETYYMNHASVLMYDVDSYSGPISLYLDCKKIYDFSNEGRIYTLSRENDCILFEYKKYSDGTLSSIDYSLYVAIKSDMVSLDVARWFEQPYALDASRGTKNSSWIYDALQFSCSGSGSIAISYAQSKHEAIANVEHAFENKIYLKRAKKNYYNSLMVSNIGLSVEDTVAYNCAIAQFDALVQTINGTQGIYAGLPWFFHFWSRDEAISTIGLIVQGRYDDAKQILFRWLKTNASGRVANRFPGSDLGSADATGWVFFRLQQLLQKTIMEKQVKEVFTTEELLYVYQQCVSRIATIEAKYMSEGLVSNDALETWMDTGINCGDVRQGFRVEIQALHYAMYSCALEFGTYLRLNMSSLQKRADIFKTSIQEKFVVDGLILDGFGDKTIRPNIFIAVYVAPNIFDAYVIKNTFDSALSSLTHSYDSGSGIATIEVSHPLFQPIHTGENNLSYHRGDVWYWINSLVAIVLHSIDPVQYAPYIASLKSSAVFAISWQGTAGCLAEISSAVHQTSEGCISQAWSYALLLELLQKLGHK